MAFPGNGLGMGSHLSIQDAAVRLRGKVERDRQGRDVIRCPGPNHSPGDRSLSVWLDPDEPGGIGVHSFSEKDGDALAVKDWVRSELGLPAFRPTGNGKARHDGRDADPVVARYEYVNEDGDPVLMVTRTKSKKFLQQRPDGSGGWEWGGITETDKVPFRLPELLEAIGKDQTVHICEGEKAVLALLERGFAATCSPGGAMKWPDHFAHWFNGASVLVLADHDKPGQAHAAKVEANLARVAANVRTVNLPGLKPGGDVFDYLQAGGDPAAIARMHSGPPMRGKPASELWAMDFPPVKFAIPGYFAEGLSLLAGAPKRGKSWLALDMCIAVATGGFVFNEKCIEGDVLYCALEDSPRRMKARLKTVCQLHAGPPERLRIWFGADLPRLGDGCEEALREWLTAHPGARMIVIDTLNYIRPERGRDEDPYSYDYRSAVLLQRIALEFGVALILIHHTRKSSADDYLESISGTNGLTGGCDAVCVLERQGDGTTAFKGRGRDVEEFEVAVQFDKLSCRWSVLGAVGETADANTKRRILAHMREAGWMLTPQEIADQTGMPRVTVRVHLYRLQKSGEVIKHGYGKYSLPGAVIDGGADAED